MQNRRQLCIGHLLHEHNEQPDGSRSKPYLHSRSHFIGGQMLALISVLHAHV